MKSRNLTQDDFQQVKDLLFKGEAFSDITRKTGRAEQTISLINDASDFEDYKRIQHEYWAGRGKKAKAIPQPVPETKKDWYTITIPEGLYNEVFRDISEGIEIKQALIGFIIGRARKERE